MKSKSVACLATVFVMAGSSLAGEYHGHEGVICSDCHTTHYSEQGTLPGRAEPGGPFSDLLLVASADRLCLACHDGTDPATPDVLAPVSMYDGSGSEFSGAGFFSTPDGATSDYGHDLGIEMPVPNSNPARSVLLSCISCHDPHGTDNYRNLVLNPDSLGGAINLTLGSDVFENSHPLIPPERGASIAAYKSSNIGYRQRMTDWCRDCHNDIAGPRGNPPSHFQRHPSDVSLDGLGFHLSPSHWVSGAGDGFGAASGDFTEGVPHLRFQSPSAVDYYSATVPAVTNQVFCGTCHLAHGGPFKSGMTWPFEESGSADLYSGCQQCHYK